MVDSQEHLLQENLASWNELVALVAEEERPLPIIVCINKQDLPGAVQEDEIRERLKLPRSVPVFRSIAKDGLNILEAFQNLFRDAMRASVLTKPI
jgi:signal recognition particle receptor subunit beta